MDRYEVLFVIASMVFAILILLHINRRVKKYKTLFEYHYEKMISEIKKSNSPKGILGDHYEKIISEIKKSNLPKDVQGKELSDNNSR